jgi:hypothetical protein
VPPVAWRSGRRAFAAAAWWTRPAALAALVGAAASCKAKASASECDQLLERYAQLVVTERYPDASAAQVRSFHDQEKREAMGDDAFKNCSSQVSQSEFDCAMKAPSADSFEKCLE